MPTLTRIAITFFLTLSLHSHAIPPDDDLGRALTRLDGQVTVVDRTFINDARLAGWKALDISINLAGLITLAKSGRLNFNEAEAFVIATAAYAAGVGSIIGLIGNVMRRVRGKPSARPAGEYLNKDGVNEFFRLSLDDQYLVAASDPRITKFVLGLDQAYAAIRSGLAAP